MKTTRKTPCVGDELDLRDKLALGAFNYTPEAIDNRERAKWLMRLSFADYVARTRAVADITLIHEACCRGRRLDLLAGDLRALAAELEDVPQPRTGGWPLRRPVGGDQSHLEEGVAA